MRQSLQLSTVSFRSDDAETSGFLADPPEAVISRKGHESDLIGFLQAQASPGRREDGGDPWRVRASDAAPQATTSVMPDRPSVMPDCRVTTAATISASSTPTVTPPKRSAAPSAAPLS
eukprot:Polyplicarium_translucidae@DN1709_c0_g1_i2.p1